MGQDQGVHGRDWLSGGQLMQVRTARLLIRPLQRADVDAIAIWQPFADPSLASYNLPDQSAQERDAAGVDRRDGAGHLFGAEGLGHDRRAIADADSGGIRRRRAR